MLGQLFNFRVLRWVAGVMFWKMLLRLVCMWECCVEIVPLLIVIKTFAIINLSIDCEFDCVVFRVIDSIS
jgi:hypothetical protein